jgi:DNA-directed RNA polymerase subunit beta
MNEKNKQIQFLRKKKFLPLFSSSQKNHKSIQYFTSLTKCRFSSFFEISLFRKTQSAVFSSKKEKTERSKKYILQKYQRSNQDTLIFQRPLVREGEWVQSGDILADCSTSLGGELCLGKNIFIAYMPWEGYNYEDAILISQRLVTEDVYTSIHIESYEVETRSSKLGKEQITKKIPEIPENQLCHLDERGIVKRGTSVKEGDILVGKVTPVQKKFVSAYEKLLYTILEKELIPMIDSSLRTPKGLKAKVLEIKILNFYTPSRFEKVEKISKKKSFSSFNKNVWQQFPEKKRNIFTNPFFTKNGSILGKDISACLRLDEVLFAKALPSASQGQNAICEADDFAPPLGLLRRGAEPPDPDGAEKNKNVSFFVPSFSSNKKILKKNRNLFSFLENKEKERTKSMKFTQKVENESNVSKKRTFSSLRKNQKIQKKLWSESLQLNKQFSLGGTGETNFQKPEKVQVYLVEKRKIQVGDKMSGRHGNKGIVSQILPVPDMPFLPDGTPLDMVLNPLGVPSRMNVGQIYECILGLASKYLQQYYRIQPFDEIYGPQASRSFTFSKLYEARKKTSQKWLFNPCYPGKIQIFDGRTGEPYENPVTVGVSYILKLVHLVDDKIHARSTGPYSLVTQQPLKGRSKYGGQRLGEMEVWAIEAYGAAFVLLEMLTIKSDDISGRMTLWSNILLNMPIYIGTPESFKVLVCELQALCLDMGLYRLNKKGFLTQIEHLMQLP